MEFPFPVLVCDIGGTNARFALAPAPGAPLEFGPHVKTAEYPDFEEALEFALARFSGRPASLIACAAGPVIGRSVALTNADWIIDGERLAARARLRQGLLLNDFEAQALSLPAMRPEWAAPIGAARADQAGPRLIIGLGTGLGAAALIETGGRHLALATEAGHMDFGPKGAEEAAIWAQIDARPHGRVSAETILSGPGLVRLHRARRAAAGAVPPDIDEIALVERAAANPESEEALTLALLWALAARFSGDLALAFLASGGVTYAGGVLPRLLRFLDEARFRAQFEDKAPFGAFMRSVGTQLIVAEDTVLAGMAAIAAAPQNYAIDFERRAFVRS